MSLARIALRIAAVEALKDRTLVGGNVLDTPNGALDIQADGTLRTDEERPFLSVYTDVGKAEGITGRGLTQNGSCVLVIESGISMAMTELDETTGTTHLVGISVPAADRTFEFFLDIVQRQIVDALTDPGNPWAEIYRSLHYRVTKIEIGGKRNTDDGQRLAGHQLRISVDLIDDPVRGEPIEPGTPFAEILAAMEGSDDPVYHEQAATMQSMIGGLDPEWKSLQRRRGMTRSELDALGCGPAAEVAPGEPPSLEMVQIEIDGIEPSQVVTP